MKRADEMREVFARFERSGESLKAFGAREGIPYTTLRIVRSSARVADSPFKRTSSR